MRLNELKSRFGARKEFELEVELVVDLETTDLSSEELVAVAKTKSAAIAAQLQEQADEELKARTKAAIKTALSRSNPDAVDAACYHRGSPLPTMQGYEQQPWPTREEVFQGWDPGTREPQLASWHRECLGQLCEGARISEACFSLQSAGHPREKSLDRSRRRPKLSRRR